ncbi:MAG: adenosylcobinamide-GDP ribazoletransferase [Candidatus Nezhaarchaeales archaeon]
MRGLKALLGFLTVIPVKVEEGDIEEAAANIHLFPLIGALLGLIAGAAALTFSLILPKSLVGLLTTGLLIVLTGAHHFDGLLDFGDALMVQGTPEARMKAMHDQRTGAGGLAVASTVLIANVLAVAELSPNTVLHAVFTAEVSAKLSMVVGAKAGKSAYPGLNRPFVEAMRGRKGLLRLTVAVALSTALAFVALSSIGILMLLTAALTALTLTGIAVKLFGGITGDVLGAMNEISRTASLIVALTVMKASL